MLLNGAEYTTEAVVLVKLVALVIVGAFSGCTALNAPALIVMPLPNVIAIRFLSYFYSRRRHKLRHWGNRNPTIAAATRDFYKCNSSCINCKMFNMSRRH